ncbi:hypothetical protein NLX86_12855 [Streptomyces sp. A3M-1-3]|uniref:hypothetical protein n=1 Tax=Streptomyces sp. A3M-1-3 TaxID=2962044 RepID=UPI0020B6B1D0|nr:hypothetical protein [Streptomyces sp. A3M-1-3]MCP3818970.1 hypothetical protein [Streptomyces sp. A3M-1-3]
MARHTAPAPQSRRLALRAGLTVAAVAAALGAGEVAHAAPAAPLGVDTLDGAQAQALTGVVTNSVTGVGQLKSLQLNPLAKTGVDPLDNAVAPQVADFKPVSTEMATGPLAAGAALKDLPVVGAASGMLPL